LWGSGGGGPEKTIDRKKKRADNGEISSWRERERKVD